LKSLVSSIAKFVDTTIGIISPRAELARKYYRARSENMYAAAKTTRMTGAWSPVNNSVNTVIGASSNNVRARIRQLVRDFPYFKRAVETIVDYTVGSGIAFQARVKTADGKLDKKRNQQIEDAFSFWADEADISGKLHFYELMQLAKRQDVESGEFLLVKAGRGFDKEVPRGLYIPYALQIYESDWLTSQYDTYAGGSIGMAINKGATIEIRQGIEYDTRTGRVLAYHFYDPEGWGKETIRVPASDVVHGFKTLRPQQLRGISDFTSSVLVAHDLGDLMDTEMDGAKMAAKWLAFIYSEDPAARQTWINPEDEEDDETGAIKKIESLENGIIEYLRKGEKVELAASNRPGSNFPPMVKLILTMIAVSTGVPYELLSGDYSQTSWSTGRMVRSDFSQTLHPIHARHIRQFCNPVIKPFYDAAVLSNRLNLPGYFTNPAPWQRVEWQPPGMESMEELRDTKATIEKMEAGLISPQEIAARRGRDIEDIYKEIEQAQDMRQEHKIEINLSKISTNMKNNPSAVMEQGGKTNANE
jgi:lambda family phage portal protein